MKLSTTLPVLLIGPDTLGRCALQALLERDLNAPVLCARPGAEALQTLSQERACRVVLYDCQRDGLFEQFVRSVRSSLPQGCCLLWVGQSEAPAEVRELVDGVVRLSQTCSVLLERLRSAPAPAPTVPTETGSRQESLTSRELGVIEAMTRGVTSNRELAAEFGVSQNTVKFHVRNILAKLNLHKRAEIVAVALSRGESSPATRLDAAGRGRGSLAQPPATERTADLSAS